MRRHKSPVGKMTGTTRQNSRGLSLGLLPQILGYHLRCTQVAIFEHFSTTVGKEMDITPGLFGMLQVIAANPGLAQSRLAEAMGVNRSTIVKAVDQLERHGLIIREPSPTDSRSRRLLLTKGARAALQRMERLVLAHEKQFTALLSASELGALIELLERLYRRTEAVPKVRSKVARSPSRKNGDRRPAN